MSADGGGQCPGPGPDGQLPGRPRGRAGPGGVLVELGVGRRRQSGGRRVGGQGVGAAYGPGAVQGPDTEGAEQRDEGQGLPLAAAGQRPAAVLPAPLRPGQRLGMPDDDEGHQVMSLDGLADQTAVGVEGQHPGRLVGRHPADVVGLVVGRQRPVADRVADPPVDLLGQAVHRIGGGVQPGAEPHLPAGLLAHLPDGRHRQLLAGIHVPLRQRPVVVAGAVDDEHLGAALDGRRRTEHDGTGGQHRTRARTAHGG
ncbi:hypothetical protein SDC9_158848 [bioreactor metagenome]|uniref:Uncharacterized protein n=1 Tax=bioreactor metagenome TaxID=1076179 RepID=A0A645FAZ2_9ZZZZ